MAADIPKFALTSARRGFMVDRGAIIIAASTRKRRRANLSQYRYRRVDLFLVTFPINSAEGLELGYRS